MKRGNKILQSMAHIYALVAWIERMDVYSMVDSA